MMFFLPKHLYQAMNRLGFPAPVNGNGGDPEKGALVAQ
jgi:hypothetical protein